MGFEDIRDKLKEIGLGHNESKVYFMLLKLGPSMAGKVAKEANIDRSACYDSLKALIKKGLVSYVIEANRKKFEASDPNRLKDYLKEKEELVDGILGGLKEMYKGQKEKSQVSMYRGYKGIKTVFEDILKNAKGGENLVIDSSGNFTEKMPYYAPHYVNGLKKNKIKVRSIVRRDTKRNPNTNTEHKFFPKTIKQAKITTNIYDNKIAMILWTDIPEAVVIENKAAVEAYKNYFEMLWNNARKL